ncbi:MAG: DNA translocase FtsK 4TM domain-containing protein [Collinsella sp.]
MARGSAQNAKGNKANNQPASAKGAGSICGNKGHESEFDEFEPLVEPSANRDIAGVVIAVLAIASFIAVISPATAPVTAAVAGFYHLGFGLGAYVLPIVILLFAATLFLGEDSPLNVRSVAGGAVVFIAVVSILSLMVPGTSDSCDLMFTPQNLSASGGYIGAFIASALQNALGKPIAMVVLGLVVVGLVIVAFRWAAFCALPATVRQILPSAVVPTSTRVRGVTTKLCAGSSSAPEHSSSKGSMLPTTVMGNDVDPVWTMTTRTRSVCRRVRCRGSRAPRRRCYL